MIKLSSIIVALLIGGGLTYYWVKDEPKRELNAVMKELSIKTAKELAQKLPRIQGFEDVLVVPIVGGRDEDTRLKDILTNEVAAVRKYTMKDWNDIRDKLEDGPLWGQFIQKIGIVEEEPPKTLEQAKKAAKVLGTAGMNLDGVLIIEGVFDQGPNEDALGAKVILTARFFNLDTGKELKEEEVSASNGIESAWNLLYLTHKLDSFGFISRFLLWIIVVCLQPWLLINLCRAVIRRKKNEWNMVLLTTFTIIDTALAWPLLMTMVIPGLMGIIFLVIIFGIAGYYNYDAMDYIERRLL
ncbi:MAG: hypothetical protein P1V97_20235 [Planctomycetota bacterium]|nr:hypothetical protein [Planctomycetota bacterium]